MVLLILGRGMTFYFDEWSFIDGRGAWDLATFMTPHNEHWSAGAVLIYKILLATVGLRSYLPYQIVVVALHLLVAAALFRLIRRESGPLIAFCAGSVFLLLGSGGEDLFWSAQIGWNAAAAAGAWALVLTLDSPRVRRPWIVAGLLLAAVATSGVGLFFLVAVSLALLLTPGRRRQLWLLLPAVVVYGVWYLAVGRTAIQPDILTAANLKDIPAYVVTGMGNAMGRLCGWGDQPGLVLAVLLVVGTIWRMLGPRPLLVGALVGVVGVLAQFTITGLARGQFGTDQAQNAHYVYTAAFFLLLAIGSWLGLQRMDRWRSRSISALAVVTAVALAANMVDLLFSRSSFLDAADQTRATITVLTRFGGSPAVPLEKGLFPIPGPGRLAQLFQAYGSPLQDALGPAPQPSAAALDNALFKIVSKSVVVSPSGLPLDVVPLAIESTADLTSAVADDCLVLQPTGPAPQLVTRVASGMALFLESTTTGEAQLYLSYYGSFQEEASEHIALAANAITSITIPDLGQGTSWLIRLDPVVAGSSRVCLGPSTTAGQG